MNPGNYLKEVKVEMSHVAFPTKRQTTIFTIFVIIISLGVAVYLGIFDFIFEFGLEKLINQ